MQCSAEVAFLRQKAHTISNGPVLIVWLWTDNVPRKCRLLIFFITGDNPLAKADGLSPRTGRQTMV